MNSLKLEEAMGRNKTNHDTCCKLCNQEEEDLTHFIMKCPELERYRDYNLIDRSIQDPERRVVELLFKQKRYQEVGNMIRIMWYGRKKTLIQKEEERGGHIIKKRKRKKKNINP